MALEQAFDGVVSRALEPLDATAIVMKVDDLIAVDWLQDFIFNHLQQEPSSQNQPVSLYRQVVIC